VSTGGRTWRGWIRFGVVGLLCGIAFNVLVAWGIAVAQLPVRLGTDDSYSGGAGWPGSAPEGWPGPPDMFSGGRGVGFTKLGAAHGMSTLHETRDTDPRAEAHYMLVTFYGMPFRSMRTTRLQIEDAQRRFRDVDGSVLERGMAVPRVLNPGGLTTLRLALRPMWPGFVLNSLVYAVLALVTMLGLARLRADRRRRRGRCVRCNYLLAGLDVCPECGATA
jgi:hypothetical protein